MKLRPYQSDLISDFYRKQREGYKKIAIIAGTGSGKTVISAQMMADAMTAGRGGTPLKVLFVVHLDVLVGQTHSKLQSLGLPCGFIKAGWPEEPNAPIQIGSIQTMASRSWWKNLRFDVIFYDEGHTTLFSSIGKYLLNTYKDAFHVPMTATPKRLGEEQLGDFMETFVPSPVPRVLQAQGFLSSLDYYSFAPSDLMAASGHRSGKDFSQQEIKVACDRPELIENIVKQWFRICPGKRTLAFCVDIVHAQRLAAAFRKRGIDARCVHGDISINDRKKMYDALKSGKMPVLTSCNVISIGFDEPSVEVGLMLRPTKSSIIHFQQLGRVMRISPRTGKKGGIILDQAGNLDRLGTPESIDRYILPRRTPKGGGGSVPLKVCPHCNTQSFCFHMTCSGCGFKWPKSGVVLTADMVSSGQIEDMQAIALFHAHRREVFKSWGHPKLAEINFRNHTQRQAKKAWIFGSIFGPSPDEKQTNSIKQWISAYASHEQAGWLEEQLKAELGSNFSNTR